MTTAAATPAGDLPAGVRRTVVPGGLRVVTEHVPGVRSAAVGVFVQVGSRDEAAHLSGASHFLEHLLFKGTPTRSAMDISTAFDEVGGEFNAYTAREYTCYHARVLDEDLARGGRRTRRPGSPLGGESDLHVHRSVDLDPRVRSGGEQDGRGLLAQRGLPARRP